MSTSSASAGVAFRIVEIGETASTNDVALRLAASGVTGPLWVSAERQTAGRGRSGRSWVSLSGNLHASLLFTPQCDVATAAELSLVAGVAIHDAVREVAGGDLPGLRVKWPNDILIADAKMGGVLIESSWVQGGSLLAVVVGIGLNLVASPADGGRSLAHLGAHGISADRNTVLAQVAEAMACWLGRWDDGRGFSLIRAAWLDRGGPVGERVSVNTGRERVDGSYLGLDQTGALRVADDGGRERRFTFGDVTLLATRPERSKI